MWLCDLGNIKHPWPQQNEGTCRRLIDCAFAVFQGLCCCTIIKCWQFCYTVIHKRSLLSMSHFLHRHCDVWKQYDALITGCRSLHLVQRWNIRWKKCRLQYLASSLLSYHYCLSEASICSKRRFFPRCEPGRASYQQSAARSLLITKTQGSDPLHRAVCLLIKPQHLLAVVPIMLGLNEGSVCGKGKQLHFSLI